MTDQPQNQQASFKPIFISVVADLQKTAAEDGEVMALIGTLGAEIASRFNQQSWTGVKQSLTRENYDELLGAFQRQGTELNKAGQTKKAYAIQALAVSLVAGTQRQDADIAAGEPLLDQLIDHTVGLVIRTATRRVH
ncbi:MAG: hypothetical protein GX970_01535 [Phyllobacteriaceae bacterium]|nr:hypothetical protein [Phyllobacteriaceae bacterium]